MNGFSSQKLYDDLSISLYNVFFTALPIMAYAGFERDLDAKEIMKFPQLYLNGQNSLLFNWQKFFLWFGGGCLHAVLVYFITLNGFGYSNNINNAEGYVADMWTFGVNTYQNVVILVTVVIMLFTRSWTIIHALAVFLSLAAWFLFVSIYSVAQFNQFNMDYQSPVYKIFVLAAGTFPTYWLSLGLCCGYCLLPFYICRWIEAHSLFGFKVREIFFLFIFFAIDVSPLQPEPVDVVRAGLKDGVISIAPNGAVELGSEGPLHSEMRPFVPPPLPAAAPPSAPTTLSSASLVTVNVVGSPNASDSASNTQGRGSVGSRGSESSLKV
jgi:magnesium-transporting ATPase (P-type)